MEKEFITYGHIIDPEKFMEIKDSLEFEYLQKPKGGLWCSPVDSDWGLKDWCLSENFMVNHLSIWTKFTLLPGTKILVIDSFKDLLQVGKEFGEVRDYGYGKRCIIRFTKIRESGYHGVFLTTCGNFQCHLPMYSNPDFDIDLNAWDCESMVLFDLAQIRITEKYGKEENLKN